VEGLRVVLAVALWVCGDDSKPIARAVETSVVLNGVEFRLVLAAGEVSPGGVLGGELQLVNSGTEPFADPECEVSRSRHGICACNGAEPFWNAYDHDCGGLTVQPGETNRPLPLCFYARDASGASLPGGEYTAVVEIAPEWSPRLEVPVSVRDGAAEGAAPEGCL
jgi:hypothetical protein